MASEHSQRLRIAQAFAAWLRSRYAQAVAQGVQQDVVDRPLTVSCQRLDALDQQTVDVLKDHVRHKRHSVLRREPRLPRAG
jgi:hypothetical protein